MSSLDEHLTAQFHQWELRGRGWKVFPEPVELEPPFVPFPGHLLPPLTGLDEARRHNRRSGFMERLRQSVSTPTPALKQEPAADPEPEIRTAQEWRTLPLLLPLARAVPAAQVESFLRHVGRNAETVALELLGTARTTTCQMVASPQTATRVRVGVEACFPGLGCAPGVRSTESGEALSSGWHDSEQSFAVVELGLGREWMLPLGNPRSDVLAAIVAALDGLGKEELGLLQILFTPAQAAWIPNALAAVVDNTGQPFFANRPELAQGAREKTSGPLFAVVIRLVGCAAEAQRAWEIVGDLAAPFSAFARPNSNHFVPLDNEGYPAGAHEADILDRLSRRSGMLLSMEELIPLLSPPVSSTSRNLLRETQRTHAAPEPLTAGGSLLLGINRHAGLLREVYLTPEHRVRHMHVLGASGTGKSTFLLNLIRQDIENGQGVAVLDPHGDLVDRVLGIIPTERVKDVVLIDPSDEEHSVGFNILAAHSDFEKSLLASDLVSVFQRLSTSWGDQMNSVLRNAILAFLESGTGGTLADLRRFLLDPTYRNRFLVTVTDPEIVYYWRKAFPQLTGNKSIGPVVTRLDEFLSRKPIRYMVSQQENRVDFSDVIDGGRILLAKLPQGLIGRENSHLLGSLLLSKLQQMAMSRQRMEASQRRDFWCYIDEFHSFITPSMAEILTGARKYCVGLTLAHQELRQLQASNEVSGAVLANAGTRVVFRVGDADARALENGFSHFEARDLQNLETGEAVARIGRSDFDFNLSVRPPAPPLADEDVRRAEAIAASRTKYARSRVEIEAEFRRRMEDNEAEETPREKKPAAPEAPAPAPVVAPAAEAAAVIEAETSSEKKTEQTPEPQPPAPRIPSDLGRGGVQHHAIQQKIKAVAEELGFRVTIEKSVLDGKGSIDLLLERQGEAIACEINVESTIDMEMGNIAKCLKAGFSRTAVICPRPDRLSRLEEAVRGCLVPAEATKIGFFSPDEFAVHLKSSTQVESGAPASGTETEPRRRGYKVKRSFVEVSPEEAKAREDTAIKIIAERLRKPRED